MYVVENQNAYLGGLGWRPAWGRPRAFRPAVVSPRPLTLKQKEQLKKGQVALRKFLLRGKRFALRKSVPALVKIEKAGERTQVVRIRKVVEAPAVAVASVPVNVPIPTSLIPPTAPQLVSSAPARPPGDKPFVESKQPVVQILPEGTFIETALGETNPLLKWGLLSLGAYILLDSFKKTQKKRRPVSRTQAWGAL